MRKAEDEMIHTPRQCGQSGWSLVIHPAEEVCRVRACHSSSAALASAFSLPLLLRFLDSGQGIA